LSNSYTFQFSLDVRLALKFMHLMVHLLATNLADLFSQIPQVRQRKYAV